MSQAPPAREGIHPIFQLQNASPNRLIHLVPDQLAEEVPDHPLFSYPQTADPQDGFVDVSSKCFANAINRTSWFLLAHLGPPAPFESIGYMGPNDIRYFLFMFAAIKVGYKMVFTSPRNSLDGHLNVLAGAKCNIFLRARGTRVDEILSSRKMRTFYAPELNELLDETLMWPYPYTKTFYEARMDPCLVLHTTGSTGLPKPITWKLGILSTYEAWRTIPSINGYVPTTEIYQQASRAYTSMPLFHTSGLNAGITWALLLGVTLVYGAPHIVPNAAYADEMHKYAGVDATMGAPSIYEELSRDADSLQRLNNFHYVVASGAPLSQKAGDLISEHTRVISNLGATETACLQRLAPAIADWNYFYWHPTYSGIELRKYMDDLYELVIIRDYRIELYQGVFSTFPHIQEWSMSDLYERHPDPDKKFLYKYVGRLDDVIVLSNGEKITPALIEATLMSHPLIKGAMVVGRGKFQPAVLIDLTVEPPSSSQERYQLVEQLLPVLSDANQHTPGHGKLDRYHILFADPQKPIHYLGQGKVQRHKTYVLYEQDFESLYKVADENIPKFGLFGLPSLQFEARSIMSWLRQLIGKMCGMEEMDGHVDFFRAGIDSLQVIQMTREINFALSKAGLTRDAAEFIFSTTSVYKNPTIKELTACILSINAHKKANENSHEDTSVISNGENSPGKSTESIYHTYSADLPKARAVCDQTHTIKKKTVVLTGSTGSLGSYLLEKLYFSEDVDHIICLNRDSNAAARHQTVGCMRGLRSEFDAGRVTFLKADLSLPLFGLDTNNYEKLQENTTHIIHNQWPVNFHWATKSFEPYIRGVRNLLNLCHSSSNNAFLLFISSVSAVGNWNDPSGVPEQMATDFHVASMGYGSSKLVSERLLDDASRVSGVRSAVCRVGIVAGPVEREEGLWNKHEYIPSIVISSAVLGAFPENFPSRDRIDWLPVDQLSTILLEIMMSASKSTTGISNGCDRADTVGSKIYHVVNPNAISWSQFVPWVIQSYQNSARMRTVPFNEWTLALQHSLEFENINVEQNPAVRLLEFYQQAEKRQGTPRIFLSHNAEQASPTLRKMKKVNPDWVKSWMRQWGHQSNSQ